jgi:hypothetical protein
MKRFRLTQFPGGWPFVSWRSEPTESHPREFREFCREISYAQVFPPRTRSDWAPFAQNRQPVGRLDSQPVTQNYSETGAESGGFGGGLGPFLFGTTLAGVTRQSNAIPGGRFRYPCLRCSHSVALPATVCRKDQRSSTARGLKSGFRPANRDTAYCLVYPFSNVHDVHYVHGGLAGIGSWLGVFAMRVAPDGDYPRG